MLGKIIVAIIVVKIVWMVLWWMLAGIEAFRQESGRQRK